jgi:hypothetical protein
MPQPLPQDVHLILQPAVVRGDGPVGERDLERPVMRETQRNGDEGRVGEGQDHSPRRPGGRD